MTQHTERAPSLLFVFAGPNGSGKSTLTETVRRDPRVPFPPPDHYINPDDIARTLPAGDPVKVAELASQEADRRRRLFLERGESFAFETVLPHPSKLGVMLEAKQRGYGVTLHFVATSSPEINIARVAQRVAQGGHDVPRDRIVDRYDRAMQLLPRAVEIADYSLLYDNSSRETGSTRSNFAPMMRVANGQVERLQATPDWMEQSLAIPLAQRAATREALHARSVTGAPQMADELRGAYRGTIEVVDRHFVVQRAETGRVIHDRAVLEIGAKRQFLRGHSVQIRYADAVAQAQDITRQIAPAPPRGRGPER